MWARGLYKSVVLVLFLLRQNPVQETAAELFGISQATGSRRWTALVLVVEKVLATYVPDPAEASAGRVVLVLHPGHDVGLGERKHHYVLRQAPRHRLQPPDRRHPGRGLLAVSAPLPGSRHDMHAWCQSDFPDVSAQWQGMGDLGYVGSGPLTPRRKPPGQERSTQDREANCSINTVRAAVERVIARLKD
ncbi:transposase family protein [Streptomyces sp. NPDC048384]|uniref:transposase family protein n=1 Tax=Streptomyces sp. NPDC048384 TaxID=3155487 RepID=UPI00342CD0DE